ncbi:MAG: hypothetical protein J0J01_22055 [Reyranella sp.]|uniref:hypothetical protein n=1 Tax=Reyranella sp. TaxID=1929291 RepID=UPI001AD181B0|nr:hypothetical protein [Reyranella sp.]MBN9089606.1 hypothetical protein [Reyranella sp.]
MSLLSRLFGTRQERLPAALALDLSRLRTAATAIGEIGPKSRFKRLTDEEQLHELNHRLGVRLSRCHPSDRVAVANVLAEAERVLPPEVRPVTASTRALEAKSVQDKGCADLGMGLDAAQLADVHAHLRSKPLLLAHDAHMGTTRVASIDEVPQDQNYACYDYLDLWSSPHIIELAAHDKVLDVAQGYFGCIPTLYSINAFWSFPHRQPHPYSQVFHRDWEDYRSLVAFTLLTPVESPEEGAHYYVETSHEVDKFEETLRAGGIGPDIIAKLSERGEEIAPLAMKLFEHTARRFDGPAGKSFCIDGYGLHRALVPQSRPRLLLWMRFGNFFNEAAYKRPQLAGDRALAQGILRRIPNTPRHQYIFRYLIQALVAV